MKLTLLSYYELPPATKNFPFWDTNQCSTIKENQCFGGAYGLPTPGSKNKPGKKQVHP
jgi:hypothetical protein